MYLTKTPDIIKPIAGDFTWDIKTDKKEIFLTFDDGPDPEVTPMVLEILEKYNARATFFCVGSNVERYPEVFNEVVDSGHAVGNHTQNHEKGWETTKHAYLRSAIECSQWVSSDLFRPPYGKISLAQSRALKKRYKLIMWDVVSGDFDLSTNGSACAKKVIANAKMGSIVVFHDSQKGKPRLEIALPMVLEHFSTLGYTFPVIEKKRLE